ncbi:serine phosphatase RsbU, regulator of sigma subunit [Candidatus Magnetobacterium bavaricum]|uniref:Serine phosphatase RsbU, regulator of sigma subunit n=1 Tax=Candidatus Magnetobacterium bavaricum TaxID=29290 RepID=A0A0F3GWM8_9BACT|nr:serine phosphatase RsbU, regulator of sigma subunit [Candidatus Magnetobacterium bavaricum]
MRVDGKTLINSQLFTNSIRWKFLAVTVGLMVSVVAIITVIHISVQEAALRKESNTYIRTMKLSIKERAKDLANGLKAIVEEALATLDLSGIIKQTDKAVNAGKESGEPAYIILMANDSTALIHTLMPQLRQSKLTEQEDMFAIAQHQETINEFTKGENEYMEIIVPVNLASQPWGVLRIGYSDERLNKMIKETHKTIELKTQDMIIRSIVIAILSITVTAIIILILSDRLTRPLISLTNTAEEIAKGNFSATDRIAISSKDEVGILAHAFVEMTHKLSSSHKQLEQYSKTLEVRVEERTKELHEINISLKSERSLLEAAHKKITDSIQYASMIQNVILPDDTVIDRYFSEHFVIWQPKDVVGGDIYIIDALMRDECLVSVIDCTGHGVPGAFVTMLVRTIWPNVVDGISADSGGITPGRILSTFSKSIRELLKQDVADCQSNVGLDGGVLYLNRKHHIVRYAGASVHLLMCRNGKVDVIKGNRQGVGYKNSNPNYTYNNVEIDITSGDMFYIATDGYIDQNGGAKDLPFGRRRLISIIENNWHRPMAEQRDALLAQLCSYQGKSDRTDDITVVGLKI